MLYSTCYKKKGEARFLSYCGHMVVRKQVVSVLWAFQPLPPYGLDWQRRSIYQIDNMDFQLLTDDGLDS